MKNFTKMLLTLLVVQSFILQIKSEYVDIINVSGHDVALGAWDSNAKYGLSVKLESAGRNKESSIRVEDPGRIQIERDELTSLYLTPSKLKSWGKKHPEQAKQYPKFKLS